MRQFLCQSVAEVRRTMRFSAKISTEEQVFSDSSTSEGTSAFEMENIVHTIRLPAPPRRAASVPTSRRASRPSLSSGGSGSGGRPRRKRDPNFTEEDELELFRLSVMGWGGGNESARLVF